VYLVGAGPGDPGLLTRHGAEALSRADVVVYDRLADNSMLAIAPADAELVYVGKQAAVHAVPQAHINELLAEHALQGKCVVRLKGGDPFVFGRGGEEATHLRDQGVPFIVVPGVSSSVAAPAYAGIPVTDRRYASSFAVITGHEDPTKPESRLDWAGIARGADTLVFLMALTNLPGIAERLVAEGRPAGTPAAVIERGTTPGQRVVTGTLADIVARVCGAGLHPPALIVVGEVVRLRDLLAWHDSQPLAGRRILVPRVRRRPSEIVRLLKAAGAETAEVPVLRSETLPAHADLVERLTAADWLVFTSPGALEAVLDQLEGLGRDVRGLGGGRLAAVGPAPAAHLCRTGRRVDYAPDTAAGFAVGLPAAAGENVLLLGEEGDDHVSRGLAERGVALA
jgi:uroporphyrinogen III methyltransferase/synthase